MVFVDTWWFYCCPHDSIYHVVSRFTNHYRINHLSSVNICVNCVNSCNQQESIPSGCQPPAYQLYVLHNEQI